MVRRRHYSISHHDFVRKTDPDSYLRSRKKRRFSPLKIVISVMVTVFIGMIIYVGSSAFSSANEMMDNGMNFKDLISNSSLDQTDGISNILILGKGGTNHPGGQLTDTIILARLRQSDKKLAMISIPRDLLVPIPGAGERKINEAYSTGWNSVSNKDTNKKAEAGAKLTSDVVSKMANIPIHYYISVDFSGFKEVVDILGGITVDVEQDIYDPLYPKDGFSKDGTYAKTDAYTTFSLKKGLQNLNGETALKYSRSRETTSDFDRARRQQKVIVAIRDKALSLGVLSNPKKVSDLVNSVGNHIRTNLNVSEIREFVNILKSVDKNNISNNVIDNGSQGLLVSSNEGFYHLIPRTGNFKEIQSFVKNIFSDASATASSANIEIEIYNGSGINGLGGKLQTKLEEAGLKVVKVETNDVEVEKTTVYDGTSGSKTYLALISELSVKAQTETYSQSGKIKVVIGKDYGN